MPKAPPKKSGPKGPRKGPISEKEFGIFEGLCHIQCTLDEIASCFSTSRDIIIKRVEEYYNQDFSTIFAQKKKGGIMALRRAQWNKATKENNTTMQIFLGKQYLGQSDQGIIDDSEIREIVFRTRFGEDGDMLSEIKKRKDWDSSKDFDVKKKKKKSDKKKPEKKKKTEKS